MSVYFENHESDYEAFLAAGPAFVCNNINMGVGYHRLHKSACNMLNEAGPAKHGKHTSVAKWCSRDLDELVATLTKLFGPEGVGFQYCAFCFRDAKP